MGLTRWVSLRVLLAFILIGPIPVPAQVAAGRSGALTFLAPENVPDAYVGEFYILSLCQPPGNVPPTIDHPQGAGLCGGTGGSVNPTGGNPPYHFVKDTLSNFLPFGLNLQATSGYISGVPTAAGTRTVTICAVDLSASSSCQEITITVRPARQQKKDSPPPGPRTGATPPPPAPVPERVAPLLRKPEQDGRIFDCAAAWIAATRLSSGLPVQKDAIERTKRLLDQAKAENDEAVQEITNEALSTLADTAADIAHRATEQVRTLELLRGTAQLTGQQQTVYAAGIQRLRQVGEVTAEIHTGASAYSAGHEYGTQLRAGVGSALEHVRRASEFLSESGLLEGTASHALGDLAGLYVTVATLSINLTAASWKEQMSFDEWNRARLQLEDMSAQHLRVSGTLYELQQDMARYCTEMVSKRPNAGGSGNKPFYIAGGLGLAAAAAVLASGVGSERSSSSSSSGSSSGSGGSCRSNSDCTSFATRNRCSPAVGFCTPDGLCHCCLALSGASCIRCTTNANCGGGSDTQCFQGTCIFTVGGRASGSPTPAQFRLVPEP